MKKVLLKYLQSTPYSRVLGAIRLRRAYCIRTSETSVSCYQTIWRNISEDSYPHSYYL
jgi:hypothetical protein